jgi:hypothetical protein
LLLSTSVSNSSSCRPSVRGIFRSVTMTATPSWTCALGTYFSIKNTAGSRERAFVLRAAAVSWALVIAFVVGRWLLPHPQRHRRWLPYAALRTLGVFAWNRRQLQIRREERGHE